jgi:hypothetical protein
MIVRFGAAICGALVLGGISSAAVAQSGIASVYAYAGEKTASGERAHPGGLTAAHRTLPLARACASPTKAMVSAFSCGSMIGDRSCAGASST